MSLIFIVSISIFVITFGLILTERFHRTIIGLAGAILMVLAGNMFEFYDSKEVVEAIDFNTLGLLFGMMVIVAILEKTGFFEYLAILVAKKTKGKPWALVVALGTLTTLLSLILDNVTTIILIVPVTIIITQLLKINPTPILMAEALLSDTGGVATLVGDPPNIMIGSAANFSFNDFLIHSMPVVIVAWFATLITLKFIYKKELKEVPQNIDQLMAMNEKEAITDPVTVRKILYVLSFVVLLFLLHSKLHLMPSMVALIGAFLALWVVSAKKDPQKILEKVELSVLLFFGSLFVIVGGLENAGVLEHLANLITSGVEDNLLLTAIIVLWSSAILSAIVDNIPLTVAMIPIISYLETQGVAVGILWWALVFGVGFGGNGSPIGSTANVIVVSKSEQTDTPITFKTWFKAGASVMFVTLTVATLAIVLFKEMFT
ncbi:ArsB/NhaD family transporter [Patescibacteria group bacterium]|nr:ArsB/NhaD family transporter [Patescibacteria group bacterium]